MKIDKEYLMCPSVQERFKIAQQERGAADLSYSAKRDSCMYPCSASTPSLSYCKNFRLFRAGRLAVG